MPSKLSRIAMSINCIQTPGAVKGLVGSLMMVHRALDIYLELIEA